MISSIGMLVAIVVALLDQGIVDYQWILIGFVPWAVSSVPPQLGWWK